jgi:protein-S-isoprenylcysteine O-methyltransferase Ste14
MSLKEYSMLSQLISARPWKSWSLVGLQFVLLAALLGLTHVQNLACFCWFFCVGGAILGLWAVAVMGVGRFNIRPELKLGAQLVHIPLPYRWIRHPMYSSLLLFSLGLLFNPLTWLKLGLWLALLLVLVMKAAYEEQFLVAHFTDYVDYQLRSWRFIPFLY